MIVKCRECGKDVSTEANNCPHCGCPQKQEQIGIPKCPTCGSTEIEKISVGDIAKTMFLWGSLKNFTCTFKCKKCGHKW
jgi:hypothetical protein